jgi:16S rRNA C967 or C1407 C5-methylase (RsmB/RsmF family)/NOL1/NOP2/fmu family ribosome biogenesis protein
MIPEKLLISLEHIKNYDADAFKSIHEQNSPVSIRINPNKNSHIYHSENKVGWCEYGYYLAQRPSFTLDPLFHAGCYYVQEASSMAIAQAFKQYIPNEPIKILDLCAAPGGKSTLAATYMPEGSILVSNEVIKSRVKILEENIIKWSDERVIITNNDPKDFEKLPQYFDVIIVDAPCSGSGLFRKDKNAINEWSESNVNICSGRQQRILDSAIKSLKPGGFIIYSTCSYSIEENETITDWMVDTYKLISKPLVLEKSWGITAIETTKKNHGYRFWPHQVKGEGFYLSILKKEDEELQKNYLKESPKWTVIKNKAFEKLTDFINLGDEFGYIKINDEYIAVPYKDLTELGIIADKLYIKKAGITLGKIMGKDFIPDHALAISRLLPLHVNKVELSLEMALNYLRKNNIYIPSEHTGWNVVTYKQIPLGWIKAMKDRTNNYYPKEWRILK